MFRKLVLPCPSSNNINVNYNYIGSFYSKGTFSVTNHYDYFNGSANIQTNDVSLMNNDFAVEITDYFNNSPNTYKVLTIGDSWIANGTILSQLKTLSPDTVLLGTKGTGEIKHEGISGWSSELFMSEQSPFFIDGKIDFLKYLENHNFHPDVICVHLTLNGFKISGTVSRDFHFTVALVNELKKAGIPIILLLSCGQLVGTNQFVLETCEKLRCSFPDIACEFGTMLVNNKRHWTFADSVFTTELTEQNGTHPSTAGYQSLGKILLSAINYKMSTGGKAFYEFI